MDTVVYAPSALDVDCYEAQLATLMLHEIKHLKRDAQGRNHDERRAACRLHLAEDVSFEDDSGGSSLRYSPVPVGKETANQAMQRILRAEEEKKCFLPLEQEPTPSRSKRLESFLIRSSPISRARTPTAARGPRRHQAVIDAMLRRQQERSDKMSRAPSDFAGGTTAEKTH